MKLQDIPEMAKDGYKVGKRWPMRPSFLLILCLELGGTIFFTCEIFTHTVTVGDVIWQLIGMAVVAHWAYMCWMYISPNVLNLQRIREWRRKRK